MCADDTHLYTFLHTLKITNITSEIITLSKVENGRKIAGYFDYFRPIIFNLYSFILFSTIFRLFSTKLYYH